MSQPQGRPRGRARGRGRPSSAAPPQQEAQRPGEPPQPRAPPPSDAQVPVPGRGRSRGAMAQVAPGGAPAQAPAPPTAQMAAMQVRAQAGGDKPMGGATRRRREEFFIEPATRGDLPDKRGTSGTPTTVFANCFKMKTPENWHIYQYNVSFEPPIDYKKVRLAVVGSLRNLFINEQYVFDGQTLFSITRFEQKITRHIVQRRPMRDGTENPPVEVTFDLTNECPPGSPEHLRIFNIIFKRILKLLKLEQIGRNYFNPHNPPQIPQYNLTLWPGYSTSISQFEEDVMLMADLSFKILHTNSVLHVLDELLDQVRRNVSQFKDLATKKLVGEIVMTRYNNKTYRVDEIVWDQNPRSTFSTVRGDISFVEYYERQYERKITNLDQPLLMSMPKAKPGENRGPILLVPELCLMTGLSEDMRSNFSLMKDVGVHTRVLPGTRTQELQKFLNQINSNQEIVEYTKKWQVEFSPNLAKVEARILPPEDLFQLQNVRGEMKETRYSYQQHEADWSRSLRGNILRSAINIDQWLFICPKREMNNGLAFIDNLKKVGPPMGMQIADPERAIINDDRIDSYVKTIRGSYGTHKLVMCVLTSARKERYDSIKKVCVNECPIPSQMILSKTIFKKNTLMSVATKVAMQLNCKLGGDLWRVEIPLSDFMVIGIDVYHDSSTRGRSAVGFVASMNKTLTKYHSRCCFQTTHQELADNLMVCLTACLKRYHAINKSYPQKIVVYRDGVGDGQLAAVVEHEVPQFEDTFSRVMPFKPKLTVVVVKKRIANRFFLPSTGGGGGGGYRGGGRGDRGGRGGRGRGGGGDDGGMVNPPPGTIVDSVVTKPQWFDFFLVSQSVRQGTVSPTSYNVIKNGTGLKPDHLQRLTYKLTHLYFNWPGTIRVPAPCLYAHKLAFLIGQSIHQIPPPDLADTLYYL